MANIIIVLPSSLPPLQNELLIYHLGFKAKMQTSNIKLSQKIEWPLKSSVSGPFITVVLTRTRLLITKAKEITAVSISVDHAKPDIYIHHVS